MKISHNWMVVAAGATLMFCSTAARAADGPYVAVHGGLAQAQAFNADVGASSAVVNGLQEHYRIGYQGDLAAGYELGPLRAEVEASQKGTRLTSVYAASTATIPNSATTLTSKGSGTFSAPVGKLRVRSAMLNLYVSTTNRDVFASGNVHFYGGAGVGYAWARAFHHRAIGGADSYLNGGAKSFAWQLMVGARYDLTPHLSLDAGYKYFSATRLRFTDYAGRRVAGSNSWNGFLVGASYAF
ncbi:MAG TPA: outer membrane beta-barrel protein [Novosphingobium sp.]